MIRHFINLILAALPPSRFFLIRRIFLRLAGVNLSKGVSFCGRGWIFGRGILEIGPDSWLSPSSIFYTHVDAPIVIGKRCDIGPGVKFITGGHMVGTSLRRAGEGSALPIYIGDGCWVGGYCIILGGVRIGNGCIVAAGSVVTQDVPDNVMIAGVPAQIKRNLVK
jgi:maltose O-acetyltransferase